MAGPDVREDKFRQDALPLIIPTTNLEVPVDVTTPDRVLQMYLKGYEMRNIEDAP